MYLCDLQNLLKASTKQTLVTKLQNDVLTISTEIMCGTRNITRLVQLTCIFCLFINNTCKGKRGSDNLVVKVTASQPRDSGFVPYQGRDHVS